MLPNGQVRSDPAVQAPFISPRDLLTTGIESWERGGIALNNPTQGLEVQNWLAYVTDAFVGDVFLQPEVGDTVLFHTIPGISWLSMTFDQNMAPFLTFIQSGIAKYYWFDSSVGMYVTTNLPDNSITPCCSLDDKRALAGSSSDILLFYIVGSSCFYRVQRERYLTEHVWDADLGTKLVAPSIVNVGMNTQYRFQVYFQAAFST